VDMNPDLKFLLQTLGVISGIALLWSLLMWATVKLVEWAEHKRRG